MPLLSQRYLILDRGSRYYKGIIIESNLSDFKILDLKKLRVIKDLKFLEEEYDFDENLYSFEYNFLRFYNTFFAGEDNLIFLFNNEEVFFRRLEIPAEKEKVVYDILENEIEAYLPVKLEDVQVLGSIYDFNNSLARLIGIAIENKKLEEYSRLIMENHLNLKMITIESFALASAINLIPRENFLNKIIGQLDIGYSKTILNILLNGKIVNTRTIPFGLKNLIDILMKNEKNKDEDSLESLIFSSFFELITNQKFADEIIYEIENLSNEIKRTLFSSDIENLSFIMASGGGSLLSDLINILEKKLNIPIQRYFIQIEDEPIEPYIIAIGAFYEFKKKEKIDFLKSSIGNILQKGEVQFQSLFIPATMVGISFIILLISYTLGILLDRKQIQFYEEQIQEVVATLPELGNAVNPVQKAKSICQKKLDNWKSIAENKKTLDVLKEISEHTISPDSAKIEFKSLRYTENQVEIELVVDSLSNVVKVQEELQKSRMFTSVEVVRRDLVAGQKVRLQLNLKIKPSDIKMDLVCK